MIVRLDELTDLLLGKELQALAEVSLRNGLDSSGQLSNRFLDGIGENYTREAGNESPDQNVNPHLLRRLLDLGDADLLAASEESSFIDLNGEESRKEEQEGSKDLDCDEQADSDQF